jgi:hypothetical protein
MSIFFATTGPNSAGSNDHSYTKYGIYPMGGKYDDGKGGRVNPSSGTVGSGIAPHKMITYASLKFMLAELALVGETTGDAATLLRDAVEASIDHVHSVVDKNEPAKNIAPKIPANTREFFVDAILARFNGANADGKMRILMTQKWIHNFMNPVDVYTDYRRTGFPLFFDPQKTQDPGYGVNPTVTERSDARVNISNLATFPRSLYYPTNSETELNPNLKQKTNLASPFVFWDK